jgi:hypothetical protein
VEQRLEISPPSVQEENYEVVKVPPAELLVSLDRLALPQLDQEERLEIIESLKHALWPDPGRQQALPWLSFASAVLNTQ